MSKQPKEFDRRVLFNYLREKYGIPDPPKHFYIYMSNLFAGRLKGMSKPIPPEHLYDMWLQKSNYLDKIYMNNVSKGKTMNGYSRLFYDLAILINKYDAYLAWLEKQRVNESSNEGLKESVSVTNVLYTHNKQTEGDEDINDISDILDELI